MTQEPRMPDSSDERRVEYFSFWKPEPVPPKDAKIHAVDLRPLGPLETVAAKLNDVPCLDESPSSPWDVKDEHPTLRFHWRVDRGVILQVRAERCPPKPGEVLTIGAASAAPQSVFYRLYVQIYEQFGATLFDERMQDFVTPREFRQRLAG